MRYILIVLIGLILGACSSDKSESTDYSNDDPNYYVEGRPYYLKGSDSTVCSEPYELNELDSNSVKIIKYRDCWTRKWEHKYTAGGQMIDVWYWDEKSCTWYSMPKTGGYYVFHWAYSTKTLLD